MTYCSKCGKEVAENGSFCSICGEKVDNVRNNIQNLTLSSSIKDDDFATFVGKNSEKYLTKFAKFNVGGIDSFKATWHWPAFFVPFWWMLYRKLYLWALLIICLKIITLCFFITSVLYIVIMNVICIIVTIVIAITANYLYYKHAKKKILALKSLHESSDEQSAIEIARVGGVSKVIIWIGASILILLFIGFMSALIIPRIMGHTEEARQAKATMQIESIESALKLYKLDNGSYPTTEQGLKALVEAPTVGNRNLPQNWRQGGYLEKGKIPKDPWGNDFVYVCPGSHGDFDLSSLGKDGKVGGKGVDKDINNWELE